MTWYQSLLVLQTIVYLHRSSEVIASAAMLG